jgi:hypothetical protein
VSLSWGRKREASSVMNKRSLSQMFNQNSGQNAWFKVSLVFLLALIAKVALMKSTIYINT